MESDAVRPAHPYKTLVVLQASPFCNIDCQYCYLPHRSITAKMSPAVMQRIFEEVMGSSIIEEPITFLWHLGEPLAVPIEFYEGAFNLYDSVNKVYQRQSSHAFQTNATLINPRWIDFIQERRIGIGVSVDGPAFIHDRKRINRKGVGTHNAVMNGIRLLQEAKIGFSAITVLTNFTLDYPESLYEFYIENNILDVAFNIDEIEGTNKTSSFSEDSTIRRYKRFLANLLTLVAQDGGRLKVREFWTTLRSICSESHNPYNTMVEPLRILNFDHQGNFSTFCPELVAASSEEYAGFKMGNILEVPISSIFENSVFKKVYQEIQQGVSLCKQSCSYWDLCGGGSPSNKFFETGRFDVSETLACRAHKKIVVDVLLDHFEQVSSTTQVQ
ncbi:cyclophane-forming radical SAM/SPASM peptide maturase GrrM/OscB [Tolypothrix sp. LEGE 11397]|uniref:cyclophane-forming radical SAM/SPASM peptide maturase GrrM/OscB n=1 Tax=Tolypothrix sp. LEGE 11397 TaxID=2777971 RepID=UPI0030DD8D6A